MDSQKYRTHAHRKVHLIKARLNEMHNNALVSIDRATYHLSLEIKTLEHE